MRHQVLIFAFRIIIPVILIATACDRQHDWDTESRALVLKANELASRQTKLDNRIDSLWDATTEALAKSLPENFPSIDRNIFLHARNADHIRMFMSYQLLDEKAKALVDMAGVYDQMLATQVRTLFNEKQEFEAQKIKFLSTIEQKDKEAGKFYAEQFLTESK